MHSGEKTTQNKVPWPQQIYTSAKSLASGWFSLAKEILLASTTAIWMPPPPITWLDLNKIGARWCEV